MIRYLILVTIFSVCMFSSCKKDSTCNCFDSTGSTSTEIRSVSPFTQIELYNNVDLVLHTDTFYHLTVTAGSNLLDEVKTEVEDGVLKLRNKNRCNWIRSFKNTFVVEVWLKAKNDTTSLENITIFDASGNIDCKDPIQQNEFRLDNRSSTGDYRLKLNCTTATLALHTGSATIYAEGHVGVNYAYNISSGKMDLRNLDSDDIYVTNSGTNDTYIKANNLIEAELGYIGNIYYTGSATQIIEKYSNTGRLINLN